MGKKKSTFQSISRAHCFLTHGSFNQPIPCSFRVPIFHHEDLKLLRLIVHRVKGGHELLLLLLVSIKEDDHDVVRLVDEHLQGVLVHIPDRLALKLLQNPGLDFNWIVQVALKNM